jgi:succinate dehydrogenase flavin-adding protein (antitoxin of CptAB toxin-antitoxin module)
MRELDVLLTRYVNFVGREPARAAAELPLIEAFLQLQDPELQRYLLAHEQPEHPELAALAARIRAPAGSV